MSPYEAHAAVVEMLIQYLTERISMVELAERMGPLYWAAAEAQIRDDLLMEVEHLIWELQEGHLTENDLRRLLEASPNASEVGNYPFKVGSGEVLGFRGHGGR